jgi:ParB family transcriptional regulator, chromosome partitioning protein
MADVHAVSPFLCRIWDGHERLDDYINEETCRVEIDSVKRYGQLIPVLCRPLKHDKEHSYELVYGARRLFVARHLNQPLLAEIRDLSDREAAIAADIENRQRKELSPYERARSYATWLRAGLFASQDDLAHALHVSASQVSRVLKLASLPALIVSIFNSPTEICENWGRELMNIWDDPERRPALTSGARAIARAAQKPAAPVIYQRLICAAGEKSKTRQLEYRDEVIRDNSGKPLFRVRIHQNDIALLLPTLAVSEESLTEIKCTVSGILQRDKTRPKEEFAQVA